MIRNQRQTAKTDLRKWRNRTVVVEEGDSDLRGSGGLLLESGNRHPLVPYFEIAFFTPLISPLFTRKFRSFYSSIAKNEG